MIPMYSWSATISTDGSTIPVHWSPTMSSSTPIFTGKASCHCDKKSCKAAIRQLIDSGRCIYSYVGGSYVTLPEGSGD